GGDYAGMSHLDSKQIGRSGHSPPLAQRDQLSVEGIRSLLANDQSANLMLSNIPNARLWRERALLNWLSSGDHAESIDMLRAAIDRVPRGIDPEEVWAIGRDLPYRVSISWANHGSDGSFDALFVAATESQLPKDSGISPTLAIPEVLANNPMQ